MSMEQETLIYVEENDKAEARVLAQSFARKDVKSRAYINALGAELGMKYLALESINNAKVYNMHSVHKILEEFDISDIMLSNIHIDVRVVFDENFIFIPKSHFEYDILPDVYFVLLLSKDYSHASFLGYFEPKLINKNNQNSEYYFIEKEKLTSPASLRAFVENFKGNTTQSLSKKDNEKAELLMVSMADQNISAEDTKELLKYLKKSADLRDEFIEFENFELLAYKAEHSTEVKIPEQTISGEVPDTTFDELAGVSEMSEGTAALEAEIAASTDNSDTESELSSADLTLNDSVEEENPMLAQVLPEESVNDGEKIATGLSDVAAIAEDVAGGLAAAGMASLGADGVAVGAEVSELAAAELETDEIIEELADAASVDLSFDGSEVEDIAPADVELSQIDEVGSEIENIELGGVNDLAMDENLSVDDLPELDSLGEEAEPNSESVSQEVNPASLVSNDGMTDIDMLSAKTNSGDFDSASLDDLMAPANEPDEGLINMGSLQEETARQKGLLPSIEDESILESSLDFSKIEAVPQVDTKALNSQLDTFDISSFDAIAPEVRLEEAPEGNNGELDVLDISDVNALPNNLGDNISETIEFDNFTPVDNTCENQISNQKTSPTANFDNFEAMETMDNAIFDTDNISLSMDTKPAPKRPASPSEVDLTGFESVDMEPFEMVPLVGPKSDNGFPTPAASDDLADVLLGDMDEVGSLDAIPNFEVPNASSISDFSDDSEVEQKNNDHIEGSLALAPSGEAEMLDLDGFSDSSPAVTPSPSSEVNSFDVTEAVSSVEDLSIDDIVDSPEESNVDVSLISKAVDMDVAQDALSEQSIAADVQNQDTAFSQNIPADLAASPVINGSVSEEAAGVQDNSLDELEAFSVGSKFSDSEESDLSMLFDDAATSPEGMTANISSKVSDSQEQEEFVPTLPHLPERQNSGNSKTKIIGTAVLIALLAAAGTFFGLNMKNKNELNEVEAISQPVPENNETSLPAPPAGQGNSEEDIVANAPGFIDMPENQTEPANVKSEQPANEKKDVKNSASKPVNPDGAIMSVQKLSWELPDYLSYSQEMKKYLQTAGKSIKLTLTSDLLLASEYAYSNQIKVSLKLSNDGAIQNAKIVQSSGSTEIDDIVLRTVKETLNVVKPAAGEVPTADFNLGLIINF